MDREKHLKQVANASGEKISKVVGRLQAQWTLRDGHYCLKNDWVSLARSVGLGEADIPALKTWVNQMGLPHPMRKKVK